MLAVIPFEDEEEAVAIGNDVAYGLAGSFGAFFHRRGLERDPLT